LTTSEDAFMVIGSAVYLALADIHVPSPQSADMH